MVKGSRLWWVAALCVLSGSGWILAQAWPSEMAYASSECIHFALIGCVAGVVAMSSGGLQLRWRSVAALATAGTVLFVLPSLSLHLAAGSVAGSSGVALFCSVPVITILFVSYFGGDGGGMRGLLLPGVVALGGALLLFPVETPRSVRGWVSFGAVLGCCVVVAATSVWMHRLLQGVGIAAAVAVAGSSAAVMLCCYAIMQGGTMPSARVVAGEAVRCVVFDLPVVWLTVWLMREVSPARLSARFLLVPLISLVEGYALMRAPIDLRTGLAMAAMLGGSVTLLLRDEPEEVPGLHLR